MFKQINLYTILTQGIYPIFIDQMPTFFVFKKVYPILALNFQQITTYSDNPEEWQGKI